jgi:hypothetical protein
VVYGNIFERCGAVIFGGVQIHGGKDNLVDGNLFLDGFAGVSFSRWGEKRWLESIARFLEQAEHPTLLARYPELATLRTGFDVNDLSRNLFVRCGPMFLRDGGKPRSVLESAIADAINADIVASPETVRAQTMFRGLLFDSIPVPEIGPYPHPWRAP